MEPTKITVTLLLLLFIYCGCSREPTDQEKHPECYRPVKYTVADLPKLINRLSDPTPTKEIVYLFGGYKAIGDIALDGIFDVIDDLPLHYFLEEPYLAQWKNTGAGAYYDYVRANPKNRLKVQRAVKAWIDRATPEQRKRWGTRKWVPVDGY